MGFNVDVEDHNASFFISILRQDSLAHDRMLGGQFSLVCSSRYCGSLE